MSTSLTVVEPFQLSDGVISYSHGFAQVRFTTRKGGVSTGHYASLNLGKAVDDDPLAVARNRELLRQKFARPVYFTTQVHGCELYHHKGKKRDEEVVADGQLTTEVDCALAVTVADCLPVALVSSATVAIIHAGWRGLVNGILSKAVHELKRCAEGEITAVFGPTARSCCYRVGDDLRKKVTYLEPEAVFGQTISLPLLAKSQLASVGVTHIVDVRLCTICSNREWFFSHRRDHGNTGRQAGIVWRSC